VGWISGTLRGVVPIVLACSAAAQGADKLFPVPVARALDRASAAGDPASIGQLVGGNPAIGVEIVVIAVTRRPELADRIAAAAADNAPQLAPQIAGAAAVANPAAAARIAAAVWVVVPAARDRVADAVVGTLPPGDRMAAAAKVHAAIDAVVLPSVDDPQ
jgi:hypothetical protein